MIYELLHLSPCGDMWVGDADTRRLDGFTRMGLMGKNR